MVDAQNKIVSIETFRATRPANRAAVPVRPERTGDRLPPSARSIEHRERMLRFLRLAAMEGVERKESQEAKGRLLL